MSVKLLVASSCSPSAGGSFDGECSEASHCKGNIESSESSGGEREATVAAKRNEANKKSGSERNKK